MGTLICVLLIIGLVQTTYANNVVVLLYHKFGDRRTPSTNVPLSNFIAQMTYLKTHNYQVISLKRLACLLSSHQPLPPKTVVITVDDGYKTVFTKAFPILRRFGYPFTVFIPTEAIEKHYPDYINWDEIYQMKQAGVDFQDHTYAHHKLGLKPLSMTEREYREWIQADLKKSRCIFEKRLGYCPTMLAFPYGYYNKILINEALRLGYRVLLSQDPGVVSEDTPLYHIPREPILGKNWSTLEHFKTILKRVDLPLLIRYPKIGFLKENPPLEIYGILKYPGRYFPNRFKIYISELGWKKAKYDPHLSKVYVKGVSPLRRKINRIAIAGVEKNTRKTAISFWMVVLP